MSTKVTVWSMALLVILSQAAEVSSSGVYQFPINMNVGGGENAIMYCKFPISQGTVDVHWWRGGMKTFLEPDSRKQFTIDSGSGTFTLQHVRVADSGLYYCQVKFQQQVIGNGSGCQVTVFDPPTPLKIVPAEGLGTPRKLVCKTGTFYPEKLEIFWRRNNEDIRTGMETVKGPREDGLYVASSFLEITQPVEGKDIYTCLVSHVSLEVAASFSYTLGQGIDRKQIIVYAVGGSVILVLIIIVISLGLKIWYGHNVTPVGIRQDGEPVSQAPIEHTTAYATLHLSESKGFSNGRQEEQHVVYSQTKRGGADKLTYATEQRHNPNKKTSASKENNKYTVYADVNTSKKACN